MNSRTEKYEIVLGMKELASKGMAAEVVNEVNSLDPNFFVENPILLFQLKQVCGNCIANSSIKRFLSFHNLSFNLFYILDSRSNSLSWSVVGIILLL